MTDRDLYKLAAQGKYRFKTDKGELTVEQLFDLPLTSVAGVSLNSIAVALDTEINKTAKSFVDVPAAASTKLQNMLAIVVDVIRTRQAEAEAKKSRAEKTAQRQVLEQALLDAQNKALGNLSIDEIKKRIDELAKS